MRRPPEDAQGPWTVNSGKSGLPTLGIPIMLIDTRGYVLMVVQAGDDSPRKHDRQPLSVSLPSAGPREAAASPCLTDNKKKRTYTTPTVPGMMADCAFSRQRSHSFPSLSVCALCLVYSLLRAKSDMTVSCAILLRC